MVDITNTRKTFPLVYCYITSELAKSFDFVAEELTKYVFYNCPEAAVICADFTKGLRAAIAAWSLCESGAKEEALQERTLEPSELPNVSTMLLSDKDNKNRFKTVLQLYEWHALKAIQRRLVHVSKYSTKRREVLTSLVNAWIKALTKDNVLKARNALIKQLKPQDCEYLINFY
jgi:hypothetical protein